MSFAGSAQMLADVQSFKASPVVEVANCMYLCMRVLAGFAQGRRRDLKVRLHMRDVEYGCRHRRGQSNRACTMAPAGSGAVVEVANCMYLCMRVLAGFAQGRRRDLKVRLHMRDVEYGCRNRRGQSYRACTMAPAGSGAVYCESSKCKGYARTIKEEQPCLICKK